MPLDLTKLQNVQPTSDGWQAACPMCRAQGGDSTGNHLHIWRDGAYNCVVSGSDREHNRGIWALAGTGETTGAVYTEPEEPKVELPRVYSPELLTRLIRDTSYWRGRGISDETLAPFQGGIATVGQMAQRYVFPQFNSDGEIIGFSGRCLREMTREERKRWRRPKWKHLSPSSTFLWGGLSEVEETRRAILVESIGDALKLRECGVPESLCIFGTVLSEAVLGYLISVSPTSIIVSTNLDEPKMVNGRMKRPGQEAAMRIQRILLAFFDEPVVRIVHPPEGVKDWGDATPDHIHAAFSEQDDLDATEAADSTDEDAA